MGDFTKEKDVIVALQKYWWAVQYPGDIIFTKANGIGSFANRSLQKLITGDEAKSSHVILCVAPGLYVHSVFGKGVILQYAEELPIFTSRREAGYRKKGTWLVKVFRHKQFSDRLIASQSAMKISEASMYFVGQNYNFLFFQKNNLASEVYQKSSAFCSEFVANVFDRLNLPLTLDSTEQLLPVHLQKQLEQDSNWNNVTNVYMNVLSELRDGKCVQKKFNKTEEFVSLMQRKMAVSQYELLMTKMNLAKNFSEFEDIISIIPNMDVDQAREFVSKICSTFDYRIDSKKFSEKYSHNLDYIDSGWDEDPDSFIQELNPRVKLETTEERIAKTKENMERENETIENIIETSRPIVDRLKILLLNKEEMKRELISQFPEISDSEKSDQEDAITISHMINTSKEDVTIEAITHLRNLVELMAIEPNLFSDELNAALNVLEAFVERLNEPEFRNKFLEHEKGMSNIIKLMDKNIEHRINLNEIYSDIEILESIRSKLSEL
ncbi:hypothetical protein [Labrenzia sp. PHM005]|uniref:hypothetical protein n=1 Tax=Labrenzia sp. PHM005 TaxID=2590016 RepID=UPI00114050C3|nr:hypothetical protein [Labrenzia sp. PHM005]QDG74424.1 hypothetical protein FJ695_00230 [Labrenzia sp. PHM005]